MPKSNVDFWNAKFAANIARDEQVKCALEHLGWNVSVIWECETKKPELLQGKLERLFSSDEYMQ